MLNLVKMKWLHSSLTKKEMSPMDRSLRVITTSVWTWTKMDSTNSTKPCRSLTSQWTSPSTWAFLKCSIWPSRSTALKALMLQAVKSTSPTHLAWCQSMLYRMKMALCLLNFRLENGPLVTTMTKTTSSLKKSRLKIRIWRWTLPTQLRFGWMVQSMLQTLLDWPMNNGLRSLRNRRCMTTQVLYQFDSMVMDWNSLLSPISLVNSVNASLREWPLTSMRIVQ